MTLPESVGLAVSLLGGGAILGGLGTWLFKGGSKWQALTGRLDGFEVVFDQRMTGIERELSRVADEIHGLNEGQTILATVRTRVDEHERRLNRLAP